MQAVLENGDAPRQEAHMCAAFGDPTEFPTRPMAHHSPAAVLGGLHARGVGAKAPPSSSTSLLFLQLLG
jgi:hypothetical protein